MVVSLAMPLPPGGVLHRTLFPGLVSTDVVTVQVNQDIVIFWSTECKRLVEMFTDVINQVIISPSAGQLREYRFQGFSYIQSVSQTLISDQDRTRTCGGLSSWSLSSVRSCSMLLAAGSRSGYSSVPCTSLLRL